ncbi:MAG TPA: hypothetical protein VEQ10_22270 [Vicinamibacteria bacterium]|nr:hypothetical protein [Vicinamibacteria bacterium]
MSTTMRAGLAAAAALAALACASTTFNTTWKSPEAKPLNFKGKKVAALCITKDESVRYGSEDALAREITARGAVGVPAYSLIPKELTQDKDKAKEFLQKAGVAGVVAMRVAGREKELNSTPGGMYWGAPYYSSFWAGGGYYGWAWGGVYSPSYVTTDTIVYVETLIYSMDQDKLVWAGRSETTNPEKVGPFVKELTAKVAAELKKEGLIH